VQVRVDEDRLQQARDVPLVSREGAFVDLGRGVSVELLVRAAHQFGDLALDAHAEIRVEVRVPERGVHEADQRFAAGTDGGRLETFGHARANSGTSTEKGPSPPGTGHPPRALSRASL